MQLDKSKKQMEERTKDERNYTIHLLYTSRNPKIVLNKDRPFLLLDFWYFKKVQFVHFIAEYRVYEKLVFFLHCFSI